MKFLFILAGIIPFLISCGAGEIVNPQPTKIPIESTSTSPNPGTLESSTAIKDYSVNDLRKAVEDQICLPGTDATVCDKNKINLESGFGFNLDQITNGSNVSAYAIQYNTPGVKNENRSVSGGVLIPQVAESQIKGIILYYHGTKLAKYDVPSCFSQSEVKMPYCLGNSIDDGEVLAGVWASQGYIVVMPDYIGQGYDSVVMHPYVLYSQIDAVSGLNMVTATKALLNKLQLQNVANSAQDFYITGYSEGGGYALWTSQMVQDPSSSFLITNQLRLKDTVGMSGAYDLTNAQLPMERDNVTLDDQYNIGNVFTAGAAKPLLTGYLFSSYGFYNLDQTYNELMVKAFLDCRTCLISGNNYTVPDLFTVHGNPQLSDVNIALYLTSAAATTGYAVNGNNSVRALLQSAVLEDPRFLDVVAANSLTSWNGGIAPIGFTYMNKDSVVTNLNSTNMYTAVTNPNKTAIVIDASQYQYYDAINKDLKPFDHAQANVIQAVAALQQFNRFP